MNKKQVIGLTFTALAVIGGVAVFNYFRKPKRNSDGFFSATGKTMVKANCGRRNTDGSYSYYYAQDGECRRGFSSVEYFGDRNI
jgi:hypothetical protein